MSIANDDEAYDALALPAEALEDGGVEILRAGLIKDELYVTARRILRDPAQWGDVLAEIARRIAVLYSAEDTDLTEEEILAQIEQAFAADLGAPIVEGTAPRRKAKSKAKASKSKARPAKRKAAKKKPAAKKAARKSVKRKKS